MNSHLNKALNIAVVTICGALAGAVVDTRSAYADYVATTLSSNPLAYWRLDAPNQSSLVNGYSTSYDNIVTSGPGAPLTGYPANTGAAFNGVNAGSPGVITTGLSGGINGAGTIAAWINLSALPSATGTFMNIASEAQFGNDFGLQVQTDNRAYFYTGAGENTVTTTSLNANQWYFLVATYDSAANYRNIYLDGVLDGSFMGGVSSQSKTANFTIGYDTVFSGREFAGLIDEVSVWDRGLSSSEVAALYASSQTAVVAGVPETSTWAMLIVGFAGVGFITYRNSKNQGARLSAAT